MKASRITNFEEGKLNYSNSMRKVPFTEDAFKVFMVLRAKSLANP
jgi:hypothetical protein